ncbi:AtaL-like protein [Kitasatospora sp. NPDC056783]|uniref:AtaL-like protein n=1 Tax=Kitasatospora sp. NPDC056783 TaxID=3345943 RepID=UPI0036AC073F
MQITLSWTRLVNSPDNDPAEAVGRGEVWQAMLHKAEEPVSYVPAITASTIEERYEVGYLRRAERGERVLVQRVTPDEQAGRITFTSDNTTDFAEIVNQLGETPAGELTLTLLLTLTEEASERATREPEYLADITSDFTETADAMTARLRVTAGETAAQ